MQVGHRSALHAAAKCEQETRHQRSPDVERVAVLAKATVGTAPGQGSPIAT
jgi:hypothetical protein